MLDAEEGEIRRERGGEGEEEESSETGSETEEEEEAEGAGGDILASTGDLVAVTRSSLSFLSFFLSSRFTPKSSN